MQHDLPFADNVVDARIVRAGQIVWSEQSHNARPRLQNAGAHNVIERDISTTSDVIRVTVLTTRETVLSKPSDCKTRYWVKFTFLLE